MGECIMQKVGGGLNVVGWTTSVPSYLETKTLTHNKVSLYNDIYKETKLFTIDCLEAINLSADVTTTHYSGEYSWAGSITFFKVYDANMVEICTFNHAPGSSGYGSSNSGKVNIPLHKGINYICFCVNVPGEYGQPYTRGFNYLSISLGSVFPILSNEIKFKLKSI